MKCFCYRCEYKRNYPAIPDWAIPTRASMSFLGYMADNYETCYAEKNKEIKK